MGGCKYSPGSMSETCKCFPGYMFETCAHGYCFDDMYFSIQCFDHILTLLAKLKLTAMFYVAAGL